MGHSDEWPREPAGDSIAGLRRPRAAALTAAIPLLKKQDPAEARQTVIAAIPAATRTCPGMASRSLSHPERSRHGQSTPSTPLEGWSRRLPEPQRGDRRQGCRPTTHRAQGRPAVCTCPAGCFPPRCRGVTEGGGQRLRPTLMTAVATIIAGGNSPT
ncbi:hypothetical protein Ssi02_37760 [Sinosporangium siamense]|uniref:Uncharacterized protein n=1 Tax=Sinosporangium siamense TaxID=1367973 RepID=A0A919RIQ5_9ACTN|nr:hypothetical protein Ssi02_37760 [Sinosporangium siamense]